MFVGAFILSFIACYLIGVGFFLFVIAFARTMVRGTAHFLKEWQHPSLHPDFSQWVQPDPSSDTHARCKVCLRARIDLSTMGRQALKSHAKSKGHRRNMKAATQQASVCSVLGSRGGNRPTTPILVEDDDEDPVFFVRIID